MLLDPLTFTQNRGGGAQAGKSSRRDVPFFYMLIRVLYMKIQYQHCVK